MLWIAPSLPYYGLAGPFGTDAGARLTKRLVFSSWQVAPKAISLVLSYAAERAMTLSHQRQARNTERSRANRAGLLRLTLVEGEPQRDTAVRCWRVADTTHGPRCSRAESGTVLPERP